MASRRDLLLGGAAAAVGLPRLSAAQAPSGPAALNSLLGQVSTDLLTEFPENATFLGVDKGPLAALEGQLTDRSVEASAARGVACRERLARLKAFDGASLAGLDRINLQTAIYAHELAAEGYRFPYGDNAVLNTWQAESNSAYVVSQGTGVFATIPDFMDNNQRLDTREDAEAYLSRLSALAQGLDAENGRMRRDAAAGSIAPDFLLDTTIKQQSDYAAQPVADWGLVGSIARRAAAKDIPGDWRARALRICEQQVAPALGRQIETLKALRAAASADAGVWKLPKGDAFYRWALKAGTTTDMSPDQVHQLGLEQVALISSQMDALLRAQGLTQGSVGERMSALSKDPRFLFPNTDAGRQQLLAYLNGVIAAIRAKLPQAFGILHKADLVIKRVPPSIEAGAPDGYEQDGPIDGSRPATYYINLRDTADWPKFSLPTLCFHEGLPGHVWQGTFVHDLPVIRSQLAFNAYIEGWALYAEQLGDELGMYADDPFGRLGYLQSIQFRACRLVVDTGLHAKRWTRAQATDWLVAHNGGPRDSAQHEIDRYCAWPGQACGYQIGHLYIDRLRTQAKAALGARFDLKGFDDAVLTSGSLPLSLLDGVVDAWTSQARRA